MIASDIAGRLRLRSRVLRDERELNVAAGKLADTLGVSRVTGNGRAGSLLIEYDPLVVTRDALVEASGLPATESRAGKAPASATATRAQHMRIAKQGMLASLGALVLFALAGRERQHAAAGVAFLAFNAYHVYTYRRRVLK